MESHTYPRVVHILGTRGVPAAHGGFETFAERLAPYLVKQGWEVIVYCQVEPGDEGHEAGKIDEDEWNGVRRILIHTKRAGSLGSFSFDWTSARMANKYPGVALVLGYNTAIFNLINRWGGLPVAMNMDGIEWKRGKWSFPYKAWFYINEWAGSWLSQDLIADHPRIADHLATRAARSKITTIPYGADSIADIPADPIQEMGLEPGRFFVSIARVEPENSILEMVQAFASRPRDTKMVVLGKFDPQNAYHTEVKAAGAAAGGKVIFPGAIYNQDAVGALRRHCLAYLHGHTVGGTNPSLVEALGAGSPVLAHGNHFNTYVAGDGQFYFTDIRSCAEAMSQLEQSAEVAQRASDAARVRHAEEYTWKDVLGAYEGLLLSIVERRDAKQTSQA